MTPRLTQVARGAAGAAGFLVLVELAGRLKIIDPLVLPLASTVLTEAIALVADTDFLTDVVATLSAWGTGLLISVGLAVPLGVLLGAVPGAELAARPIVEFLRPIPSVALIPLASLIFASHFDAKVSVIVYACAWPVLFNTIYGLHDVDPLAKETLRSYGFGRLAVLWRVSLPSAAPFIATGIRLGAAIALILAISAELLAGGAEGIGVFVTEAGGGSRSDLIIAATLWAGGLGLAANALLVAVERRVFRWHQARAGVRA